jgi:hypothetical protein
MALKRRIFLGAGLLALALGTWAEAWDSGLPASLDKLAANAWQESLLTAFGTFTYADTSLPSPFSRYLEDSLKSAITKSSKLKLFNKSVASAMDPAFREAYGSFFKNNSVDALLSGRYYLEGQAVRARLELTGLSDGVLLGTLDLRLPVSTLPSDLGVEPSSAASTTASSIGSLDAESGKGSLRVSVSTERGAGAVYRDGEKMVILVTVNKPAWLKVYHVDATGVVRLIWPNAYTSGRRIDPGAVMTIPGPGDGFEFDMVPPFGTEFIKVLASTQPFAVDEASSSKDDPFAELGTDARGAMTRGLALKASGAAELAEALASYVITHK